MSMQMPNKRNRLLPWYIGLAIILAADIYIGYLFHATSCPATGLPEFMVLIVMPAVYLALMYVTLRNQP